MSSSRGVMVWRARILGSIGGASRPRSCRAFAIVNVFGKKGSTKKMNTT